MNTPVYADKHEKLLFKITCTAKKNTLFLIQKENVLTGIYLAIRCLYRAKNFSEHN